MRLNFPQTCVLALNAPERVPFLDGDHWQWADAFDMATGENLLHTDPSIAGSLSKTRAALLAVVEQLTRPPYNFLNSHIFVLGYAQGGSIAVDLGLQVFLGGVMSINGPPFSLSLNKVKTSTTPMLCLSGRGMAQDTVCSILGMWPFANTD